MSGGAPKAPITYEGEHDAARTYLPLRIVTFDGGVYLSVATSTGVDPDPAAVTPWLPLGSGSSGLAIVGPDEPASPATGQLWYDTDATC